MRPGVGNGGSAIADVHLESGHAAAGGLPEEPKPTPNAKGNPRPKPKNTGKPVDKDKTFEELWAKSVAARKFYLSTMATAVEIDSVISEDVQWEWARNGQNQGKLKHLAADAPNSTSVYQKAFLAEEPSAIRKRYRKHAISVELSDSPQKNAVNQLAELVKLLEKWKVG